MNTETLDDQTPMTERVLVPSKALTRSLDNDSASPFANETSYELAKRMANALAQSTIVPTAYHGNPANCMIALEMANRTGTGVMAIMQNVHVINGRPGFASSYIIASINTCGRFSPLRFRFEGDRCTDNWSCTAYATELATGDVLDGEPITWKMAKGEGWISRKDSKWQTMPGQMIRYRAASFWQRVHAPELSLGMRTAEENEDIEGRSSVVASAKTRDLNKALDDAEEMIAEVVQE